MTEAQAAAEDTSEKPQEMKEQGTKDQVQHNDTKEADDSMDAESMHRDNNDEDDDDDSESGRKRRRSGADMQTEDGTEGGDAAVGGAAVRVKSGRTERRAVDREKTCPFLVRVYVKAAEHHSLADISAGKAKEDEHHLHLWKDSTLREISHLLSSKMPELNDPEIRLTFKILFHEFSPISSTASSGRRDSLKDGRQQRPPPPPHSRTTTQSAFKAKDIGQLSNMHKRTSDEFLTLEKVNFVAGDMIDVCIIKGVSIAGTAGTGVANAGINIAGKAAESHYGKNGNGRVSIESRLGSRRTAGPGAFGSESVRDRRGSVADEGRSYGGRSGGGGGGGGRFHPYSAPSRGGRGGGSRASMQDDRRSRSGW
ncbi:Sin3 associated polypeptide p18-domain-containing protein [Chytriomyces cf. hyalinus JEL632]|nr:Sin3 associated polypeptide p18-domain-containing protein [Chytriomyces cf. hyalinus JEL632]